MAVVPPRSAERRSGYLVRVVVLPLMLIVALSWVIFWMDRESLSNRINISFIALLTVVAFQIMVEQALPAIPDLTLMAGFLAINYVLLAATIVAVTAFASIASVRYSTARSLSPRSRRRFP